MEDIMVAGAFGCARNYGGDGPFKKSYLLHDAVGARHADLSSTHHSDFRCWYFILWRDSAVVYHSFFQVCGHCVLSTSSTIKIATWYQKSASRQASFFPSYTLPSNEQCYDIQFLDLTRWSLI